MGGDVETIRHSRLEIGDRVRGAGPHVNFGEVGCAGKTGIEVIPGDGGGRTRIPRQRNGLRGRRTSVSSRGNSSQQNQEYKPTQDHNKGSATRARQDGHGTSI